MLSKNKTKFIVSLQRKKIRDENMLYVIEGDKIVKDYISSGMPVKELIAKPEFINSFPENALNSIETESVSYEELKQISNLKTPHNAIAIVQIPEPGFNLRKVIEKRCIALDCIQDPGNLGTIIRAAAWFGIKNIVCSEDCVDSYNPKVIQASMGALIQVNVFYTDLIEFLTFATGKKVPVYGTMLKGKSIYDQDFKSTGVILFGNESKGISEPLKLLSTDKIMIPRFSESVSGIDSLNAAMAVSIVLSEFARKTMCDKSHTTNI